MMPSSTSARISIDENNPDAVDWMPLPDSDPTVTVITIEGALRRTLQRWQREDQDMAQLASVDPSVAPLLPFVLALARLAASEDLERSANRRPEANS